MAHHAERDRTDGGRFTIEYDDGDLLAAIDAADPATTTEIAAAVGCSRRTAYGRLQRLEADGRATSMDAGGVLLWRRTD